ncbi:uncharacterized protein PV09_07862 [Verruconis gallopava]|uniref:F-box domain-containing protein n=1 Tax=Verruconis gallopava TaxID=253628 RepID=A0A0D2A1R3_9PEZI|nr:uncharacterized protein PV09_07862 [Verruconis gallopava]KIW00678.1 hypothetical protein PV09_07862 [Verruconis gallopava]
MASRLPAELLSTILQQVHRNSRDSLLTCMQCNSQFFEIGFDILYRNVSLRLKDAVRFEKAVKRYMVRNDDSSWHFPFTRCFRIVIPGDGRDYGYGAARSRVFSVTESSGVDVIAKKGIDALKRVLRGFSKMRTFSIVSYNGHRLNTWDPQGLGIPPGAAILSASSTRARGPSINLLADLVYCLPDSVRDLSIDLSELSRYDPLSSCVLCPAINKIAPQLEHLNLHLRTYCNQLLVRNIADAPTYSSLQSVIIRIHGFSARLCCKYSSSSGILNLDMFTRNISTLIQNQHLPQVKQFILISKRRPIGVRQHSDVKWTIYVRELVSNQTAAIPRIFIDSRTPEPGNTFTVSARTMVRLPSNCTFIDDKYWDKEYVGKSGSIRRFVEGRAGWVSFAQGPHIPGLRKAEIRATLDEGYDVRAPQPRLASEFRAKEDKTCKLWMDEDAAGIKLLEPAVWSGVLDNRVLQRADSPL